MTPDEALDRLRRGNINFLNDTPNQPALDSASRLRLAAGQQPFAAYVSCSDSRVPPELLFGKGLGELFIIRNAGNTVDTAAMGSLEFAVGVLKVPLIVVMGHEACGAVKAAMSIVHNNEHFPGNLGKMIQPILPAVLQAAHNGQPSMEAAVRQNVRRVVRELREEASPILLHPQTNGTLKVVGAYYHLSSGSVDFFDK